VRHSVKRALGILLALLMLLSLFPASASADGEAAWMTARIQAVTNYSHYTQTGQYYEGAFVLWKNNVLLNDTPIQTYNEDDDSYTVNYSDEVLKELGIRIVWTDSTGQEAVIDYDSTNSHYFGGPARVGQYSVKVTQTIGNETRAISDPCFFEITPTTFYKFTDYSNLETGARWYLYSIMGEMDGQLYVMSMPGIDATYRQEAIPVQPDGNGGVTLGFDRENVFMLKRSYYSYGGHYLHYLETGTSLDIFITGDNGGSISRGRYNLTGDDGFYIDTDPDNNYAATIYEPNTGHGRFLLAKDGAGNVFFTRAVYSTDSPRTDLDIVKTAPVYLYWNQYIEPEPTGEHTYEFLDTPYDKEYDGEPIAFDESKNISVDGGKTSWAELVEAGEARLVWRQWQGKEQVEIDGPPAAVGQYAVVIQEPGKGGGKEDFGGKDGKEDVEGSGDPGEVWVDVCSESFEITESSSPATYSVTFHAVVGSVSVQFVAAGEKAVRPDNPKRVGWWFGGWCADEALTTPFDFNTPITADTDVYAKWVQPDLILPGDLISIEEEAFAGGAFSFAALSVNTASVGPRAFADCPKLAYILIPNANTAIAPDAFGELQSLTIFGAPDSTAAAFAAGKAGFTFIPIS
jgi:Listeria-Bacteroides repeat domain (List_Bact_rpt).